MSSAPIRFILVFGRNESPNTCSVTTRCISGQMRNMHLLLLPRFRYLPSVIGRSNPAGICRQSQTQPVLPPIPDHAVYPISSIGRYHAPIQPYQDDHLIILSARFRPMRGGAFPQKDNVWPPKCVYCIYAWAFYSYYILDIVPVLLEGRVRRQGKASNTYPSPTRSYKRLRIGEYEIPKRSGRYQSRSRHRPFPKHNSLGRP